MVLQTMLISVAVLCFIRWYRYYSNRNARRSYAAYYRWMKGGR